MTRLLDALATSEELDAGDVYRVDCGAIVGKQSSERTSVDFGTVDDSNGLSEQAVTRGEDGVVDL